MEELDRQLILGKSLDSDREPQDVGVVVHEVKGTTVTTLAIPYGRVGCLPESGNIFYVIVAELAGKFGSWKMWRKSTLVQALQQQLEQQDKEWQEQLQAKEKQIDEFRRQSYVRSTDVRAPAGGNTDTAGRAEVWETEDQEVLGDGLPTWRGE